MPRVIPKNVSEEVEARVDLTFGRRSIPKGTRLSRSDPAVLADPQYWQIPAVPLQDVLNAKESGSEEK